MAIVSSFDKRPVYLDNNGQPLVSGSRIYYYVIGTSTPKTVYSDYQVTTPAANPQVVGVDGRTDTQIFPGVGQYTVKSYSINNGVDPSLAVFPDDFAFVNQWVEEGQPSPAAIVAGTPTDVGTIADLRALNPIALGQSLYNVHGYYAAGDMFPREYIWDPIATGSDNNSTVIQAAGIVTGRYRLKIEGPAVDVRIGGIFPGRTVSANGLISALYTAIANESSQPRTIYWPAGTYQVDNGSQTAWANTILDHANFKVTSGTYTLSLSYGCDVIGEGALKHPSSVGNFVPLFSALSGKNINVKWYGAACDGVTDDGEALRTATSSIGYNNTLQIPGPLVIGAGLGGAIGFNMPVEFIHTGRLKNDQSGHTVSWTKGGSLTNNRTRTSYGVYDHCLDFSGAGSFNLSSNTVVVKTSWLGNNSYASTLLGLQALGAAAQEGTTLLIDSLCSFSADIAVTALDKFVIDWVPGGQLYVTGTGPVHLPNAPQHDAYMFACSPGAIVADKGRITPYMWWNRTSDNRVGFNCALASLAKARYSADLDLCGQEWTSGYGYDVSIYNAQLLIRNGRLNTAHAGYLLNVPSGGYAMSITIRDIIGVWNSTASVVRNQGVLSRFVCENSTILATGTTNFLQADATIAEAYISNCNIVATNLLNGPVTKLTIVNNPQLTGDLVVPTTSFRAASNTVKGGPSGVWKMYGTNPPDISGSTFTECDLALEAYGSLIRHTVRGNSFFSTDAKWSRVLLSTSYADTVINGLEITDNHFFGTQAASIYCIEKVLTGVGSWAQDTPYTFTSAHRMKIADNTTANRNTLYVPQTVVAEEMDVQPGGILDDYAVIPLSNYSQWVFYLPNCNLGLGFASVVKMADADAAFPGYVRHIADGSNAGAVLRLNVRFSGNHTEGTGKAKVLLHTFVQ
ncbi:MAG: hypothetical protein [Bacteriophage sp.]|nr:MAG: hypothetical protein [Bacteriophage sp.]